MTFEHQIEWNDKNVSRLWDYYSRTPPYSEIYFSKVLGDRILKKSGLPLNQEIDVLDFGCGPGFIWEHLCKLGSAWNYTGLDFSPDSVAKLRTNAKDRPKFKGVHHISQLPVSLPSEHYDVVLMIEVVEHLKDEYLDSALSEARRLLKRGGVLVITTPNDEDLSKSTRFCPDCGALFHEWQHVRSWTVASLANRLKQHGFDLCKAHTLDFVAHGFVRRSVRLARRLFRGIRGTPHMIAVYQKT
jgi:SAM-dependent methyltransferase